MKIVKLPNPTLFVLASLGSFWLAKVANPGFMPIAFMFLLLIPVLLFEMLYPESEIEKLFEPAKPEPITAEEFETEQIEAFEEESPIGELVEE